MKNDPCPCGSGKKYRQCCWLRRFEPATPPPPLPPAAPTPPPGLYAACECGSGKVYRRCCYPRTFPDPTKSDLGFEPHLDHAATCRAFKRLAALPPPNNLTIDTVDVGRTRLDCAPLPPVGDTLPGTLAPPTPRQIEAKYDLIREGNPDGVTEVVVDYTYPEEFGVAEARMVFDADDHFTLDDGRVISVLELARGMRVRMADGGVGTVTADPEFRHDHPVPPLPSTDGLWSSRVVGSVKHTAYEMIVFRWAGQQVEVTPGHMIWSADRQWWLRAYELEPGELVRVGGNVVAPVEGPGRVKTGPVVVFGIEVEYFHNYFVGRGPDAMLVHNGPECVGKPAVVDRPTKGRVGLHDEAYHTGYDAIFGKGNATTRTTLSGRLPQEGVNGSWGGTTPGNGVWRSTDIRVRQAAARPGEAIPAHVDIQFKSGYPVFDGHVRSAFGIKGETRIALDVDAKASLRTRSDRDFSTANEWLSGKLNEGGIAHPDGGRWSVTRVRDYLADRNLQWHHHENMTTMQLLDRGLHDPISHIGGRSLKDFSFTPPLPVRKPK